MPLQDAPQNYEDLSDEYGFQFRFYCEVCNDGFKTQRIKSQSAQKSKRRGFTANVLGAIGLSRASDLASATEDLAEGGYEREHEHALQVAIREAKTRFKKCPACKQYVCNDCWNVKKKKCSQCASE